MRSADRDPYVYCVYWTEIEHFTLCMIWQYLFWQDGTSLRCLYSLKPTTSHRFICFVVSKIVLPRTGFSKFWSLAFFTFPTQLLPTVRFPTCNLDLNYAITSILIFTKLCHVRLIVASRLVIDRPVSSVGWPLRGS